MTRILINNQLYQLMYVIKVNMNVSINLYVNDIGKQ